MLMKIIALTGPVTEKPMDGKNYSLWSYPVTVNAAGQTYNITLKSFTKQAMLVNAGQDMEVDKQVKDWNGKQMTDYIIKNEKKHFTGGGKFAPREKLSTADFKKLVVHCWQLALELDVSAAPQLFDKILGVASMNLDIASIQTGAQAISNVFAPVNNDSDIPF